MSLEVELFVCPGLDLRVPLQQGSPVADVGSAAPWQSHINRVRHGQSANLTPVLPVNNSKNVICPGFTRADRWPRLASRHFMRVKLVDGLFVGDIAPCEMRLAGDGRKVRAEM